MKKARFCSGDNWTVSKTDAVYSDNYVMIPKKVLNNPKLTITAKYIYAYFCSYANMKIQPSRKTILKDLGISKSTYYLHLEILKSQGYLIVLQCNNKGKFAGCTYSII